MNPCVNVCYREIVVIIQVALLFHGKWKELFIFVWQVLYLWRVVSTVLLTLSKFKVVICLLFTCLVCNFNENSKPIIYTIY